MRHSWVRLTGLTCDGSAPRSRIYRRKNSAEDERLREQLRCADIGKFIRTIKDLMLAITLDARHKCD